MQVIPNATNKAAAAVCRSLEVALELSIIMILHHPLVQLYAANSESITLSLGGVIIQQLAHALDRLVVVIQDLQVLHSC